MARIGRPHAALGAACALLLAVGGIAVADRRSPEAPRSQVGTEGPAHQGSGPTWSVGAPTTEAPATSAPVDGEEAGGDPAATAPRRGSTTTPRPTTTTSTVPAGGSTGSIVDGDAVGPGPHDLRGRVAYLNDTPVPSSLWSMRPDGSDHRLEVACPPPEDAAEGGLWYPNSSFDLSPDGRHVVRSCPVTGSDQDGVRVGDSRSDLVVQDVDGVGSRTLWRYSPATQSARPQWSPDGERIAVLVGRDVVVVDADGSGRRTVATLEPYEVGGSLVWSPDGRFLASAALHVIDVATGVRTEPLRQAEPWPYGMGYISTLAFSWDAEGLWWLGTAGSASRTMEEIPAVWRLDAATGKMVDVVRLPPFQLTTAQPVPGGWWAASGGDPTLTHIGRDGTIRPLTGVQAFWVSIAGA